MTKLFYLYMFQMTVGLWLDATFQRTSASVKQQKCFWLF